MLSSLGEFMEKKILPISPKLDTGEAKIAGPAEGALRPGHVQDSLPRGVRRSGAAFLSLCERRRAAWHRRRLGGTQRRDPQRRRRRAEPVRASEPRRGSTSPPCLSGKSLASFTLTEPASGSDAGTMATTAVREGGRVFDQRFEDVHHQRRRGGPLPGLREDDERSFLFHGRGGRPLG